MKKLLIILFASGLTISASAQHYFHGTRYHFYRPHVVIGLGAYAPSYPYYGYPFYPPSIYSYGYGYSKLDLVCTT